MKIHPLLADPSAVLVIRSRVNDPPTADEFHDAGRAVLEALDFGPEGRRVVIKPNVTIGEHFSDPDSGITTHPAFVHGMIDHLNAVAGLSESICILEDPRNSDDNTPRDWHGTGYPEVASETGAELCCPSDSTCVTLPVPEPLALPTISVSRHAVAEDALLINVPKLKTHNLAITTLCMKNLMGAVNGVERHFCAQAWREMAEMDSHAGQPKREWMDEAIHRRWQEGLAKRLIDTARIITPQLNVVEGVVGREGTGFQRGRNRAIGLVIAGTNMVAVDATASYLVGFGPEEIVYLDLASKAGLGEHRVARLRIYSLENRSLVECDDIESLRVDPPFRVISDILGEEPVPF